MGVSLASEDTLVKSVIMDVIVDSKSHCVTHGGDLGKEDVDDEIKSLEFTVPSLGLLFPEVLLLGKVGLGASNLIVRFL